MNCVPFWRIYCAISNSLLAENVTDSFPLVIGSIPDSNSRANNIRFFPHFECCYFLINAINISIFVLVIEFKVAIVKRSLL